MKFWDAVCRHGPCGPISSLHPWDKWVPPDFHGFKKWVFDSFHVLNGFFRQNVVLRGSGGIRQWNGWLRKDLSSRPYVPLSLFLLIKDPHCQFSRIFMKPHFIDAEFRKARMPYFCQSGDPDFSPEQFLEFIGHFLLHKNLFGFSVKYGS